MVGIESQSRTNSAGLWPQSDGLAAGSTTITKDGLGLRPGSESGSAMNSFKRSLRSNFSKAHTSIQTLGLGGTRVTDAGLAHLNGLKSLGRLVVGHGVTDAGVAAIRQALPTIEIIR